MNEINRKKVEDFMSNEDCSPLKFEYYESPKDEFIQGEYSIIKLVKRASQLSQEFASMNSKDSSFEASSGRWRSAFDLWRHIIYYYPDVEIFDVMHALYEFQKDFGGQYCTDVNRRTFKVRGQYNYGWTNVQEIYDTGTYKYNGTDEFGLVWDDWKDI